MAITKNSLRGLYVDELRDLYSAEKQLTKALPKMAKAATSDELRNGFTEHLEQTRGHVERLEQIFEALGERSGGKKCAGMEGLIEEGSEVIGDDFEGNVMDAALIGAAQRVEHYEIAAYGTACAFAQLLGETEHLKLLQQTLDERSRRTKNSLNSRRKSMLRPMIRVQRSHRLAPVNLIELLKQRMAGRTGRLQDSGSCPPVADWQFYGRDH